MIEYKSLENVDIADIIETFIEAFSDYKVKFKKEDITYMITRRSFDPYISMGAFKDGKLIGFILNGHRIIDGIEYAYDTGTGVIKEYRNQKITQVMIDMVKGLLKEKGINKYILEVLQDNESAFHLYSKVGFKVSREFDCFYRDSSKIDSTIDIHLKELSNTNIIDTSFCDIKPSWQNDIQSINSVIDSYTIIGAFYKDKLIGYGIITNKNGDIPQLAVAKEYRLKGVGQAILNKLIEYNQANTIAFVNIEKDCKSLLGFFDSLSFENKVSQYEMILDLD